MSEVSFITTSLSNISFDEMGLLLESFSVLGAFIGRGGGGEGLQVYNELSLKSLLLRIPMEVITMVVVVAECGLLLAWGKGVPLQ